MDQAALQPFVQMMMGWVDRTAVLAAAELGLADHLASGPRTIEELAADMAVDHAALARFLRVLTTTGTVTRAGQGRYELAPMGQFLRTNVPARSGCRAG
jgi:predicted transcriptional regulator